MKKIINTYYKKAFSQMAILALGAFVSIIPAFILRPFIGQIGDYLFVLPFIWVFGFMIHKQSSLYCPRCKSPIWGISIFDNRPHWSKYKNKSYFNSIPIKCYNCDLDLKTTEYP